MRIEIGNETGGFSPGNEGSGLGSDKDHITKKIMASEAIVITTTSHVVVTKGVSKAATLRTLVRNSMEGNLQLV